MDLKTWMKNQKKTPILGFVMNDNKYVENVKKEVLETFDKNNILKNKRKDVINKEEWDRVAKIVRKNILRHIKDQSYTIKIGFTVPSKYKQTKLGRKLR
jgi:6-pyruvoyl-tetrahydropterin synthase